MTTNQIAYQANLIKADEAAANARKADAAAREAEIANRRASEEARHNWETENLKIQELAQELDIAQQKLDLQNRENIANYGLVDYNPVGGDEAYSQRQQNFAFADILEKILSPIKGIFSYKKGG